MKMIRAYQGYFRAGRFVSRDATTIPDDVEAIVVVTDKVAEATETKAQKQGLAIKRFIEAVQDEAFDDDDFAELENNRANFSRAVEL